MRLERQKDSEKLEKLRPSFPYYISEYIQVSLDQLTPTTVLSYTIDIQDFFEWFWHTFVPEKPGIKEISLEDLERLIEIDISHYRSHLKYREDSHNIGNRYYKTKNKDTTISRKISALRSLFEYLTKNTNRETGRPYLSKNVLENTKVFSTKVSVRAKAQKLKNNIIRLEELTEFQDFILEGYGKEQLSNMEKAYWKINRHRDAAIISLLLTSGIRVGELSSLRLKDVIFDSRKLVVERKRSKEDVVFFSKQTLEYIVQYLEVRESHYKADDKPTSPLFVTKYAGKINPISKNTVQKMIMKYAKIYGKPELTAHILRHSFGTNVFKKTKNIRGVQEALGHSSINTTQIYTHMFEDDERELIDEVFE
ncbi:tyrosine recombinase XerS [Bacillus cereus]|uniref:tyrosine recombinase XerS n=1 Tax=Bacillus cereus group TaxID=86661 RepID=UPI000BF68572|nr:MULTISPECIES: tyrosine recombinase XerS [Bacillus cereus group]MDA1616280.1 tyrosine recombinase XerS [Bacillus cereus group sp. TH204-1LC]PFB64413.1 tyrosine recombinase XerS [Bacillus cereus]PFP65176.1 tyrosine recombinase XerS [Bacillus cereus]PGT10264.1 tyrosine recombinase XerS [Bacillus cereus]